MPLRAFARQSLGGVMTPARFDFLHQLPREATGKLMKKKLQRMFVEKDKGRL